MKRRVLLIAFSSLIAGCAIGPQNLDSALPAKLGDWTKQSSHTLAPHDAPEIIQKLGLDQAIAITYSGPATVELKVFRMKAATSAFELIQKWRQQDGLAVYSGSYFVVADPSSGRSAAPLLEGLRKHLSAG